MYVFSNWKKEKFSNLIIDQFVGGSFKDLAFRELERILWEEFFDFSLFLFFFFALYENVSYENFGNSLFPQRILNEIIYSYVISFMQYEVHDVIEYRVKINLYILYAILIAIKRKKTINEKKIHSYEQFSLFTIILLIINCQTFIFSSIKMKKIANNLLKLCELKVQLNI